MPKASAYSDEDILKVINEKLSNGENVSLVELAKIFPVNRNRLHSILSIRQKERLELLVRSVNSKIIAGCHKIC